MLAYFVKVDGICSFLIFFPDSFIAGELLLLFCFVYLFFFFFFFFFFSFLLQNYNLHVVLQPNQVKRFAQESRFGFVVQNLNPFFVRTSQIEIEKTDFSSQASI